MQSLSDLSRASAFARHVTSHSLRILARELAHVSNAVSGISTKFADANQTEVVRVQFRIDALEDSPARRLWNRPDWGLWSCELPLLKNQTHEGQVQVKHHRRLAMAMLASLLANQKAVAFNPDIFFVQASERL